MKNILTLFILLITSTAFTQQNIINGYNEVYTIENGITKAKTFMNQEISKGNRYTKTEQNSSRILSPNATATRWFFQDPLSIAADLYMSGNGQYSAVGWRLNNERLCLYGNQNNTPLWTHMTNTLVNKNFVWASDTAGSVALGSYQNFYLFDKSSNVPSFVFDLAALPDSVGTAGPTCVTSNGDFFLSSAVRSDTSTVYGFRKGISTEIWKLKLRTSILGMRMSNNDSLVIINSATRFWVIYTYTGVIRYFTTFPDISQTSQGISGNGNIIANINNHGYLKVYQWSDTTYQLLWEYQEPANVYYSWASAVDISNDGNYVCLGTQNNITSGTYDGNIRYFKVSNGNTPIWSYLSTGDQVTAVRFSKNSKIVAVTSWGDLAHTKPDLYIFNTRALVGIPIFTLNTPGSLFACSISNDGTSLIAGGKAVHARPFGSGGLLYNVSIDTTLYPTSINNETENIGEFKLEQNYPNPFNPRTRIEFQVSSFKFVKLKVFDILGKEVATLVNEKLSAGTYSVNWNAAEYPSGVYFYKLITDGYSETKRMLLLK